MLTPEQKFTIKITIPNENGDVENASVRGDINLGRIAETSESFDEALARISKIMGRLITPHPVSWAGSRGSRRR